MRRRSLEETWSSSIENPHRSGSGHGGWRGRAEHPGEFVGRDGIVDADGPDAEGTPPQSLDPGLDYTTQGSEVNWLVYTGLTTYRTGGTAGAQLIPGLATALPVISNGGKTYTATLRKGLVFSNGKPVVASDFTYTVERALKIPWGGASAFITPNIVGATAYPRARRGRSRGSRPTTRQARS